MIEKYESQQARSDHAKGAALADLRSALLGKLSSPSMRKSSRPTRPEGTQGRAATALFAGLLDQPDRRRRAGTAASPH
jgi:hypothetical protein